jgi:cytochrome c5
VAARTCPRVWRFEAGSCNEDSAGCQSAIQQTAHLRYKTIQQFAVMGWEISRRTRIFLATLIFPAATLLSAEEPSRWDGVDHAAIIQSWDEQSFSRGSRLYQTACVTCHGTPEKEGTLPTSRRFWLEPLTRGSDPLSLFKTIGDGFDQMPAQPWLTPEHIYDLVHYIREAYLKPYNEAAYFTVTDEYLAGLPEGDGAFEETEAMIEFARGPKYQRMDFGPVLFWTFEVDKGNIAYKGMAVRLDVGPGGISKGNAWMVYDHDTMRVAAAWTGNEFVDWRNIAFDGSHGTHTRIVGTRAFVNPVGPGWSEPDSENFEDRRLRGRDNKPYGPLPRDWAHYKGLFLHENRAVIAYTVGDAQILEQPGYERSGRAIAFSRTLNVGRSSGDLLMRIAPEDVPVMLAGETAAELVSWDGFHLLRIAASATPLRAKVLIGSADLALETFYAISVAAEPAADLAGRTRGGPPRWDAELKTSGSLGSEAGPFAVDAITEPAADQDPWQTWMRFGGFDFFENGARAAICTWNGDVWIVNGIDGDLSELTWRRIASGLFQPLGLRIVDEVIHVTCRDQIARLHDLNGNGEIDFIESFNNDHQVTEHFHEFAMGLQTDDEGNFYYAKSARHALPGLVPHHGTLLKVSRDGATTEVLATGFRAANGVCVNDDGSFFVTDQEGHWIPKNPIHRVRPGGFYGNMWIYSPPESGADEFVDQPLVWITNEMDRSPSELLWVASSSWGPFDGALLNLSYGTGRIFLVLHEEIDGQLQGGVVPLPVPEFPTGIMRGRFHPRNGDLYVCGMFAWAGNKTKDGGFYRVRYTGKPAHVPVALRAGAGGVTLEFSDPLDARSAQDPGNYGVKTWSLERTARYGSPHVDERELSVSRAALSSDGQSVFLEIPGLQPTRGMEIRYTLRTAAGASISQRIHNTIHRLPDEAGSH